MRPTLSIRSRRLAALLMGSALFASSIQTASSRRPATRRSVHPERSLRPPRPDRRGHPRRHDQGCPSGRQGRHRGPARFGIGRLVHRRRQGLRSHEPQGSRQEDHRPHRERHRPLSVICSRPSRTHSPSSSRSKVKGSKVSDRYDLILNAVAVTVPDDDVAAVAKLPGVKAVYPDTIEQVQTDTTPGFIGAPTVWANLGGQESAGEGVIVGVLDTGIWPEHPSFADPDPSGKAYAPPPAAPDGSRACEFGSTTPGDVALHLQQQADRRERGSWTRTTRSVRDSSRARSSSARDDDGHGTHTSSTAAGDAGVSASIFGVAARDHLRASRRARTWMMFKVCGAGGCFGSDSAAAVEARDRRRRQRHQLLDRRRVEPVLRHRRARVPRRVQRRRLRCGLGRQRRPGSGHHRSSRPVGDDGRREHDDRAPSSTRSTLTSDGRRDPRSRRRRRCTPGVGPAPGRRQHERAVRRGRSSRHLHRQDRGLQARQPDRACRGRASTSCRAARPG